ncbi:hypothetical protein V5799_025826 [Amblyomma americanum]|uniref:VASt domain-containing protein n=1 Tax=Amblyomma americanum TaxID=6943 RepID=A0AAQ4E8D5_AMBAM
MPWPRLRRLLRHRSPTLSHADQTLVSHGALWPVKSEIIIKHHYQILHKASQPGQVYAIDCDVQSTGVPYSDAFCVKSHYCLARLSDSRCRLRIYGCVRYKKSVWGLVKAVIEKNTLQGLEGFCNDLESALLREAERLQPAGGGGLKQRRRRLQSTKRGGGNRDRSSSSQAGFGSSFGLARVSEGRRLGTGTAVKLLLVL